MKVYLIGSLRNPKIPAISAEFRAAGLEVFDDWFAAGPEADDYWRKYEQGRHRTYTEALKGHAANHVFWFDFEHLRKADAAVLALPAGKSAHLELGWMAGKEKPTAILLDTLDRWDVMYKLVDMVSDSTDDIIKFLCSR